MTRQEEILLEVAKRHNLTIGAARHAFLCIGEAVKEVMDHEDTRANDTYNTEAFKVVGIQGFGKFIPAIVRMEKYNLNKKEKNEL